jgi:dienelactone hydrolase
MKRLGLILSILFFICGLTVSCSEKQDITGQSVEYSAGDLTLKGYLAHDKHQKGRRPGILVVHEWWGQNKQVLGRADMLAGLGYTALAVDMYGDGRQAGNFDEASKLAQEISNNPDIRRARFMAALDFLKQHETVDPESIAAIGYSFGGNTVLKMALEGADLDGVVSFYGGFLVEPPTDPAGVKARMLILHGDKDWYVTPQMLAGFKMKMKKAGIKYELISYEEANHGYTNPEAEALKERFKGMRLEYNEAADKKSWEDMSKFLQTIFYKF